MGATRKQHKTTRATQTDGGSGLSFNDNDSRTKVILLDTSNINNKEPPAVFRLKELYRYRDIPSRGQKKTKPESESNWTIQCIRIGHLNVCFDVLDVGITHIHTL
jgi:hypothetical protein